MLIAALFVIVQTVDPRVAIDPPAIEDEITVIGRRLRDWRGSLTTKGGAARCVTRKSTGDADIDAIGCEAMVTCFPKFEGEFRAVASTRGDKEARTRMNAEINRRLAACIGDRHADLTRALADRRVAVRP